MQPHPFYQAIIDANIAAGRPHFHQVDPAQARAMLRATMAAARPVDLPVALVVEDRVIDGPNGTIPVRSYVPEGASDGTIVYFHSGGWVIGDLDFSDATCRRLAVASGARLVSVEYRLAPEHPYPEPLDDAWAALRWAAATFAGPILVAGESAGGNLAAACAIRARDAGAPTLAGLWLAYPVTDCDFATGSYREIGPREWLLSTADMQWFWDQYCPIGVDRTVEEISVLRIAEVAGLPPAMVVVGQLDPLRDEGIAFATRLATGGIEVTLRCDPGMVHGYLGAAGVLPGARAAIVDSGRWMRQMLGTSD